MDVFLFHLMPYPELPENFDGYETSWLTYPRRHFDPRKGQQLYKEYLDQLVYAEELGFDGVSVNEHHQTTYGMMPCPDVMAALIVRETKRMKIAIIGNALPLRDHPLRVAEEIAVLDCVSGGRIISGFVRGIGVEYFTFGSDPTRSRERFNEAHDLIIKAWTELEPFEWISKNYRFRYVNVWPRCFQEPHPPIWVPGFGSPETFDWVAKHRYTFMSVYAPTQLQKSWLDGVRAAANRYGYDAAPAQLGALFPIHVADTNAEAHAAAEKHIAWLFKKGLKHKLEYLYPPGYMSMGGMRAAMTSGLRPFSEYTYQELVDEGFVIAGSPESVREQLLEAQGTLGFGTLATLLQFGDMPNDRARASMELFAQDVMPALKAAALAAA